MQAVAVQFLELVEGQTQVVEGVGAPRVPGQLDPLPRGEVGIQLPLGILDLALQQADLLLPGNAQGGRPGLGLQVVELALQFGDGLFEVEKMSHAGGEGSHRVRG